MKITFSDKLIAWLTLFSGLSISAVAVYYSVAGLVSIFAAAAIPIMIMGVALEVSKLVATVWIKWNWTRAPRLIKIYLMIAITILMMITSMGIFGYLSKAHLDQAVPTGDVADKVSLIDEKIKTQKENIDAARKALKQMDESVDQVMARSTDEKGADKAAALRRGQARERSQLQNDISKAQKEISILNDERAPIAKELRKVEAEVGPIKYIAALIYGDNPDQNLLEAAVRWVIIIIVIVFDPLAVILLLASQYSFQWFREEDEPEKVISDIDEAIAEDFAFNEPTEEINEAITEEPVLKQDPHPVGWAFPRHANIQDYQVAEDADDEVDVDDDIDENEPDAIKDAKAKWKHDHPGSSLKQQRRLFENGVIDHLPWEDYIQPNDEAAIEAKKWAIENPEAEEGQEAVEWANERLDERPGDYIPAKETYMENVDGNQVTKTIEGYHQNEEQTSNTLWNKIQQAKK
jgi:hypothetical protein